MLLSSARWIRVNKSTTEQTTLTARELVEDTEYEFRVIAVNKVGEGPPGEKSKPVGAKDPWGECVLIGC